MSAPLAPPGAGPRAGTQHGRTPGAPAPRALAGGRLELHRLPGRSAVRTRCGRASLVLRPRALLVSTALTAAVLVVSAVALSVGDYGLPLREVGPALLGRGDPGALLVVQTFRLPRLVVGLLVGAALGLSGALTQSVARNPIASPDVLGVTAGAGLGAVAVIVLGAGLSTTYAGALAGGTGAAVLVAALAWHRGSTDGPRLLLVGVGTTAVLSALTSWLLVRAEITAAQQATVWLTGSLNGRGWEHAAPVGLALLLLVPLTIALTRLLGTLRLGDDVARGLGTRVGATRVALVLAAVALAAVAVASAGPVAFVALVAPQVALRLARTPGIPLLTSALTGALLVVASDVVARQALPAVELPVGAVTAVVGAPYLLWLLTRSPLARGKDST